MNIGIVIVNFNDAKNIIKLIENLEKYKIIDEIVVVDNKSTDDSIAVIKSINSKKTTIIENDENLGYAYALNVGSKYLNGKYKNPYIILSNSDIEIPNENVIKELASTINEEVKCVMPKIKEGNIFKYGWKLTNTKDDLKLNIPYFNRFIRNKLIYYKDSYFKKGNVFVDVVYGCFFMIEGDTLKSIDYFDDKTFLYYEEYILAKKLESINKKSMVNTSVYVIHEHDKTIGTNLSKKNKYKILKKSQLYYEKTYNEANSFEMFLFKIFYLINLIPYSLKSLIKK